MDINKNIKRHDNHDNTYINNINNNCILQCHQNFVKESMCVSIIQDGKYAMKLSLCI